MHLLFLIWLGGFIGAFLRYLISGWAQNGATTFPVGTLTVNVLGSFILSTILFISEYRGVISDETRIFLTIGLLGAFTTMSTFSYESFRLLESRDFFLLGSQYYGYYLFNYVCRIYG